jgi:Fe-S cluster biogenesis protein NfuA
MKIRSQPAAYQENMTMEEKIRAKLEELRGFLQADGGDMDVVEIDGTNVKVRLKGACGGCPHATMTIKQGLERILREQVDANIVLERVS